MSGVNRGVIAASTERKRWLTGGGDGPSSPNAIGGNKYPFADQDGNVSSIIKKSRTEAITKELRRGYCSADVLRPRNHLLKKCSPLIDFASSSFLDRFVNLPDGREVARAAVAIAALRGPEDLKRCADARTDAKNIKNRTPTPVTTKAEGGKVLKKRATFLPTPTSIKKEQAEKASLAPLSEESPLNNITKIIDQAATPTKPNTAETSQSTSPAENTPAQPEKHKPEFQWVEDIVKTLASIQSSSPSEAEKDFIKLVDDLRSRKLPDSAGRLPTNLVQPAERVPFLRTTFRRDPTRRLYREISPIDSTKKKKNGSPKFRSLPHSAILARVKNHKAPSNIAKALFPDTVGADKPEEHVGDVAASQLASGNGGAPMSGVQQTTAGKPKSASTSASGEEEEMHLTAFAKGRSTHWKKLKHDIVLEKQKPAHGDVEATGTPIAKTDVKMPSYASPPMSRKLMKRRKGLNNNRIMSAAITPAKRSTLEPGKAFIRLNRARGIIKKSPTSPSARPQRKTKAPPTYKDLSSDDQTYEPDQLLPSSNAALNITRPSRKLRSSTPGAPKALSGATTQTSSDSPPTARKTSLKSINYKATSRARVMTPEDLKETLDKITNQDVPYYLPASIINRYQEMQNMDKNSIPEMKFDHEEYGYDAQADQFNSELPIVARLCHTNNSTNGRKRSSQLCIFSKDPPVDDIAMLGLNGKRFTKNNPLKTDITGILNNDEQVLDKYIGNGVSSRATKYLDKLAKDERMYFSSNGTQKSEESSESSSEEENNNTSKKYKVQGRKNTTTSAARRTAPAYTDKDNNNTVAPLPTEAEADALMTRVCGSLRTFMRSADLELCAQWARRDFSAFPGINSNGDEALEVTLNVKNIDCDRCSVVDTSVAQCEESIVLKLWRNMTWRKVRRLRHVLGSD